MRVPDYFLKCVGFIGEYISADSQQDDYDLQATGFFVSYPSFRQGHKFHSFVTAKHVALKLQNRPIEIIVNKKGGGVTALPVVHTIWYFHPTDPTVDIAVTPFNITSDLDIITVATDAFIGRDEIVKNDIGIGDEVFIPGLFTVAPGVTRNMPIMRHGTIAMIPEEQIQIDAGFTDAYLIEARSIGGISGSPVFVRKTMTITGEGESGRPLTALASSQSAGLLGVMHGHWDIKESEMNSPRIIHDAQRGVNLGIGVVIPAGKLSEVLENPGLVELRNIAEEHYQQSISPHPDNKVE